MISNVRELYGALRRQEAQTMAEYGVVLAVICVATVAIFTALSGGISTAVDRVVDLMPGGVGGGS